MKHVEIGHRYAAKVSGRIATVLLKRESPHGGWDGINVDTGRPVRIKSAQRLRYRISPPNQATESGSMKGGAE